MLPDDDLHGGAASLESDMHFDLGAPDSLDLPYVKAACFVVLIVQAHNNTCSPCTLRAFAPPARAGEYDSYAGLPAGNGYDDSPMGGHVHSQPHSHGDGSGGGSGGYAASRGGYSSGSAKPAGSQRSMDTHRTNVCVPMMCRYLLWPLPLACAAVRACGGPPSLCSHHDPPAAHVREAGESKVAAVVAAAAATTSRELVTWRTCSNPRITLRYKWCVCV